MPAYPLPADLTDMTVMRIVFRNGVSMDLMHLLVDDIRKNVAYLDGLSGPLPREGHSTSGFHH